MKNTKKYKIQKTIQKKDRISLYFLYCFLYFVFFLYVSFVFFRIFCVFYCFLIPFLCLVRPNTKLERKKKIGSRAVPDRTGGAFGFM